MKKITTTILLFAFFTTFCSAQWTAGLQYSQDLRKQPYGGYQYLSSNSVFFCGTGESPYVMNTSDVSNSTTSLQLARKNKRWQLGLGIVHQVRDIKVYGLVSSEIGSSDKIYFTVYDENFRPNSYLLPTNRIEDYTFFQKNRYLGLNSSLRFYWLDRPHFKSFLSAEITFSEKYSDANQTEVYKSADSLLSYAGGFGFQHRLGMKMNVQYGATWQQDANRFFKEDDYGQKIRYLRPFLQLNYALAH